MRILHVIGTIVRRRGGPVAALAGVIALSDRLGYQSSVLTVRLPGEEHRYPPATTIHRMPVSFPARAMASRSAAHWMARHHADYDLIVLHESYSFAVLQVGRRLLRCTTPYVMVPHASLHPSNLIRKATLKHLLGRTCIAPLLRQTRMVWTTSELERSQLQLFSATPRTLVLPLPVEPPAHPGDRARFRHLLGAADDDLLVAFAGRFDRVKQVGLLIRAVAACLARHPRLRLVLAGAGDAAAEKDLRALVAASGLAARTTFTGFIDAAARNDLLAGCDLFAMPSAWENFSVASVEAMQAGVPVLLSRNIGIGAAVVAAEAGWVCEPRLPDFADALAAIASAPAELSRRAGNARRLGASYAPSVLMECYATAIHQAADRHA